MRERIIWPLSLWLLVLALDLSILLAIGVALDDRGLLIAALLLLASTLFFWWSTRLEIRVTDGVLYVGKARIEARYIGEVIPLDTSAMRIERSVALDPRAYLALRYWVKSGAKVMLTDDRDPTPYWLFSTRKAKEIRELISD